MNLKDKDQTEKTAPKSRSKTSRSNGRRRIARSRTASLTWARWTRTHPNC